MTSLTKKGAFSESIFGNIEHLGDSKAEIGMAREYFRGIGFDEKSFALLPSNELAYLYLLELAASIAHSKEYFYASRDAAFLQWASAMFPLDPKNRYANLFLLVGKQVHEAFWFWHSEPYYHEFFKANYQALIPGSELAVRKNNVKHVPDFWLTINSQYVPVEIKEHPFDDIALKQLQRYMRQYHCNQGIAVAPSLSVPLPHNVQFVSVSDEVVSTMSKQKSQIKIDGQYVNYYIRTQVEEFLLNKANQRIEELKAQIRKRTFNWPNSQAPTL